MEIIKSLTYEELDDKLVVDAEYGYAYDFDLDPDSYGLRDGKVIVFSEDKGDPMQLR